MAYLLRPIVVHMKEILADIEIILPTICSSQDITDLHLHILGGIFRTGYPEKPNKGLSSYNLISYLIFTLVLAKAFLTTPT